MFTFRSGRCLLAPMHSFQKLAAGRLWGKGNLVWVRDSWDVFPCVCPAGCRWLLHLHRLREPRTRGPSLGTRDGFPPSVSGSPVHLCPNNHLSRVETLLELWACPRLYFPSSTNEQQYPELIEKEELVFQGKKGFDLRD